MKKVRKAARRDYPIPRAGQITLSLNEVCGLTGIGMTKIREAIDAEQLPARRLGKKVIVRRADIDGFLMKLPSGFNKKDQSKANPND